MTHDYEAALRYAEKIKNSGDALDWYTRYHDTFTHALKLAHKVTQEPSDKMLAEGNDAFNSLGCGCADCELGFAGKGFKAMITQAKKEIKE